MEYRNILVVGFLVWLIISACSSNSNVSVTLKDGSHVGGVIYASQNTDGTTSITTSIDSPCTISPASLTVRTPNRDELYTFFNLEVKCGNKTQVVRLAVDYQGSVGTFDLDFSK